VQTYWCEYAWLGGITSSPGVLIEVQGHRIASVSQVEACPAGATRLPGLTLPGLANGHSHAFHRALRGRTQKGHGSFWTWREQMYSVASRLTPDSYFRLARAAYGEMVMAGITAVGEFHYLHHGPGGAPYADPNAMSSALAAAAEEAGVRLTLLDTCYLHGGFGVEPNEVQMRFSDGTAERWAERVSGFHSTDGVVLGAAVHSVRAVDADSISLVAEWAAERNAPLHAHVSEQPAENEQCLAATGRTPTELLDEQGALGERFTSVHATHLTEHDIRLHGDHRCTVCMCPTTERDLADGVGPARLLREAGAPMSLGSDSHAVVDLFEEARGVELDERLHTLSRGHHTASSLLRAATADGHASLGRHGGGRLVTGAPADFVTIRLDSVRTAGCGAGPEVAVFAATAADVHHVVTDGAVRVSEGRHVAIDVAAELTAVIGELQR
jgi:formiminoglutamate deiminase